MEVFIMTWKDNFPLGIPQIDKRHRELWDIVDKFYSYMPLNST